MVGLIGTQQPDVPTILNDNYPSRVPTLQKIENISAFIYVGWDRWDS